MLVLNRMRGETIMVGDNVEITVVKITGKRVLLSITAPKSVPVFRRELYDKIKKEESSS